MNEKRAILAVSFGTSYHDTFTKTIGAIEAALRAAFPACTLRRAFTSGMIIRKLRERDGVEVDDVPAALEKLAAEGFSHVVVQPTHVMHGDEYDKLTAQAAPFQGRFQKLTCGRALLSSLEDYQAVGRAILDELPGPAEDTAFVFMGHGTGHYANAAYAQLEYLLHDWGRRDILVGTVEGYPGLDEVKRRLAERPAVKKALLLPLMIVAGDHACNDLAGAGEDSWRAQLESAGYSTACLLKGLGEYPGVRALFVEHAQAAWES